MNATTETVGQSGRLSFTGLIVPDRVVPDETFSISVQVRDSVTNQPVADCPIDFLCYQAGLERIDDGGNTDGEGVARATFRASSVGEFDVECFACTKGAGSEQEPSKIDLVVRSLPPAPIPTERLSRESLAAAERMDRIMDAHLASLPPPPEIQSVAAARNLDEAARTVSPITDETYYALPIKTSHRQATIAGLAILTGALMYFLVIASQRIDAPFDCRGQTQDGKLVYTCVPK